MKTFRRWYWISSAFFRKYLIGIIVGLIIGVVIFTNFDTIYSLLPIKPTQRIGRVGAVTLEDLPIDIQYQISRGLTKVDSTGDIILDAAQTISMSEDAKKYTVTLNPSLSWSDGTRFTTDDINIDLKDVEIVKESQEVISFTLDTPFAPFPAVLSQPLLRKVTTGRLNKNTEIIGLEEYRITKINTHNGLITSLVLESNTDKILYYFFPTEEEAIVSYKLGKIDKIQELTSQHIPDWHRTQIESEYQSNRYLALFFNTADPLLQDKSIRQLLAYSTPKPADETRVISPISQESWAYNPQVKPYHFSQETAKNTLDKLIEKNPNLELSFTITTTPAYEDTANQISQSWQEIGIDTQVKVVAFPDTNNYQILLIGQQIPTDPDQYALWHSTQSTNITKYQNAKIDKLLEDGRQEKDKEERKQIYQDFQRFLVEDSPAVFLGKLPLYQITRE